MRVRFRQYATAWYDYLMVSRGEMEKLLEGTGWGVERFIESEGSTYVAVIGKDLGPSSPTP
ncbi:hypothetical protein A3K69_08515 [Candidatus Bathyarchaeota archaeon RBG_16_57_9]|nr:MAG: hypothetical protein A3K69_08515 [Candidatus Bathyarchaeota archaeon RBG_16_57_9]